MKLVVINKTLNEERNIARFCHGFDWADLILVADGGSQDQTASIAETFGNVKVRPFEQRLTLPDGSFMNPEPAHVNFLLDWAIEEGADWVIFNGCDTWPGPELKRDARQLFSKVPARATSVKALQIYLRGKDQYFPRMNIVGPALWAWRPDELDMHCDEAATSFFETNMPKIDHERSVAFVAPPYYLLHHFYPDEQVYRAKMERYRQWGYPQTPILESIYAPPESLPDWIKVE